MTDLLAAPLCIIAIERDKPRADGSDRGRRDAPRTIRA